MLKVLILTNQMIQVQTLIYVLLTRRGLVHSNYGLQEFTIGYMNFVFGETSQLQLSFVIFLFELIIHFFLAVSKACCGGCPWSLYWWR